MKIFKKFSVLILAMVLCLPVFSMQVMAADGAIQLTDISDGSVGKYVYINCVIKSDYSSVGNSTIVLNYDTSYLRFESGENVEKTEDGTLKLSSDGGDSNVRWAMKFQALAEGTTGISIGSQDISDTDGSALTMSEGSSSITIGPGDASLITEGQSQPSMVGSDVEVEVNGKTYTLTSDAFGAQIPIGYENTPVSYNGEEHTMYKNENSGVILAYLKGEDGNGAFFVFDEEKQSFSPYMEIAISDKTSIVLLSDTSEVSLPAYYMETTMPMGDYEFPVWQDNKSEGYYVVYAINNTGDKDCYRYDVNENTYQRLNLTESTDDDGKTKKAHVSIVDKILDFFSTYFQLILLFGVLAVVLALIAFVVLSTKLRHRNKELDSIYKELGLNSDSDKKAKNSKKEKKKKDKVKKQPKAKKAAKKQAEEKYEDAYEDDYEDEYEDEFEYEDEYEDVYKDESEDLTETRVIGYEEEEYEDEYEDEFEDDFDFDDEEDDFATGEIEFEDDFATGDLSLKHKKFSTAEILLEEEEVEESDFGFDEDFLENVDTDDEVVFGGHSSTGELTIDDLDELLSEKPKKKKRRRNDNDTFKVDFIDLD